jgi:hypothetical protein
MDVQSKEVEDCLQVRDHIRCGVRRVAILDHTVVSPLPPTDRAPLELQVSTSGAGGTCLTQSSLRA